MEIVNIILYQLKYLFLNPFLYFGVILIYLQYKRQISLERKLFSSRLHSLSLELISSLAYGLMGGILVSILIAFMGIVFYPEDMWLVWMVTGFLTLFHVRFLCLSYSAGIVGITAGLIQLYADQLRPYIDDLSISWIAFLFDTLVKIHIPSLIAIVAILHLAESILIKLQSHKQATPLFIESKRGKLIGGFQIQSFWLVPLFLVVSTGESSGGLFLDFSWWPLIGGAVGGLSFIPVPVVIGYSDLTSVYTPFEKTRKAAGYLFAYSVLLLAGAFLIEYWREYQIIAALFAGFGHELVLLIGRRKEKKLQPKYVHPKDGLKILAVLPGSIAEKMGIQTGEIIKKVNGKAVATRQELYDALQLQSTFVRLEILNWAGHVKFAQHSIYSGEHHQLGIILSPDEEAGFYIDFKKINLLKLLSQKIQKISKGA